MENSLIPQEQFFEILVTLKNIQEKQAELAFELRQLRKNQVEEVYSLQELADKFGVNYNTMLRNTKRSPKSQFYLKPTKTKGGTKVLGIDWEDFLKRAQPEGSGPLKSPYDSFL